MASTRKQWQIPFAIQLVPAGCLLIGAVWLRESPRWLFANGRREEGLKNLCWIRGDLPADHPYMIEEVDAIEAQVEHDRIHVGAGFWKPFLALRQKKVAFRIMLGSSLFLFQNGSGINAINYYSPTVFKSLGVTGTNTGFLTTGIFGVVKTVLTLIWLFWLIDNLGRTKLLMIGAAGGSICMWYIAAYIKVADPTHHVSKSGQLSSGGISAMFFFYLWTAFYTPSWNGTPWVINSEMYSQQTRSIGQAFAVSIHPHHSCFESAANTPQGRLELVL
jgi:sugar porter (SP) family MFS transporter